jgi:VWFA-related protein
MLVSGALIVAGLTPAGLTPRAFAQAPPPTTIKTETRLVLVDVVVTKKGQYVEDLEMKNFKVWEDNKEQQLKTFSFGADPKNPADQKRYIVLFFDNSTMGLSEQAQARQAAARFIESNAGPDRLMAVVNFSGTLQVAQNFTDDIDRLKQVVSGIKVSSVAPGAERASLGGGPRLNGAASFGARTMLLALRSMAQNLSEVRGRKSLILLTSGFPLNNELRSEANAAIDACNKSNVAVYPIRSVSGAAAARRSMLPKRATSQASAPRECGMPVLRWRHRRCCASLTSWRRRWNRTRRLADAAAVRPVGVVAAVAVIPERAAAPVVELRAAAARWEIRPAPPGGPPALLRVALRTTPEAGALIPIPTTAATRTTTTT